jgi:hypothetical protein|uniref:Uncharacterized protein n=1 Tax=Podoviridae sp. ctz6O13 TaxID=2827757 RepID=A0A8S5TLN3_9CAUD|nr:MAG TPA: hypothetical protein [Podoviridae sp. ctz6O13]
MDYHMLAQMCQYVLLQEKALEEQKDIIGRLTSDMCEVTALVNELYPGDRQSGKPGREKSAD